jgi:hypothetical protein
LIFTCKTGLKVACLQLFMFSFVFVFFSPCSLKKITRNFLQQCVSDVLFICFFNMFALKLLKCYFLKKKPSWWIVQKECLLIF